MHKQHGVYNNMYYNCCVFQAYIIYILSTIHVYSLSPYNIIELVNILSSTRLYLVGLGLGVVVGVKITLLYFLLIHNKTLSSPFKNLVNFLIKIDLSKNIEYPSSSQ